MALDFRASQVRTNKLILSGATKLLVYPYSVASNESGGINSSLFSTSSIGSNAFLYVSGSRLHPDPVTAGGYPVSESVFGGNVTVSGGLTANYPMLARSGVWLDGGVSIAPFINYYNTENSAWQSLFLYDPGDPVPIIGNFLDNWNYRATVFIITSSTALSSIGTFISSSVGIEGKLQVDRGISGSHQRLTNGNAAFVAGTGITINFQSDGAVGITGSAVSSSIFTVSGVEAKTTSSVAFDSSNRYPSQIGTDVFFFVSGTITHPITATPISQSVFGGNVFVSGGFSTLYPVVFGSSVFIDPQDSSNPTIYYFNSPQGERRVFFEFTGAEILFVGNSAEILQLRSMTNTFVTTDLATGFQFTGSAHFKNGITGSHQFVDDSGNRPLLGEASTVTVAYLTNGQVALTASIPFTLSGSWIYTTSSINGRAGSYFGGTLPDDLPVSGVLGIPYTKEIVSRNNTNNNWHSLFTYTNLNGAVPANTLVVGNTSSSGVGIYASGSSTPTIWASTLSGSFISGSLNLPGVVTFGANIRVPWKSVSGSYTVTTTDHWISVNTSGSTGSITLLGAEVVGVGCQFIIKDGANSASINNITITASGTQTIDASGSSFVISTNKRAVGFISTGTNWESA